MVVVQPLDVGPGGEPRLGELTHPPSVGLADEEPSACDGRQVRDVRQRAEHPQAAAVGPSAQVVEGQVEVPAPHEGHVPSLRFAVAAPPERQVQVGHQVDHFALRRA